MCIRLRFSIFMRVVTFQLLLTIKRIYLSLCLCHPSHLHITPIRRSFRFLFTSGLSKLFSIIANHGHECHISCRMLYTIIRIHLFYPCPLTSLFDFFLIFSEAIGLSLSSLVNLWCCVSPLLFELRSSSCFVVITGWEVVELVLSWTFAGRGLSSAPEKLLSVECKEAANVTN